MKTEKAMEETYVDWRTHMMVDTASAMADELIEVLIGSAEHGAFTCREATVVCEFLMHWGTDKKVPGKFMQAHAHSDEHGDEHYHTFDSECVYCQAEYFNNDKQEEGK
jgi:hypothetical protein